jgi:hypothetical protein
MLIKLEKKNSHRKKDKKDYLKWNKKTVARSRLQAALQRAPQATVQKLRKICKKRLANKRKKRKKM